jgi:hypothetical protein
MVNDVPFYDNGEIKVTKVMFQVPGTQFPIRNIGAVNTVSITPERKGPIICIVVGIFLIAANGLGLIGIIAGVLWWISQKTLYVIQVISGGATQKAYASYNADEIREIQSAVNSAIAHYS